MRINSNIPKTFSIYAEKNGKCGFIRLKSSVGCDDSIVYSITFVKNNRDASKFVNFDNVKKIAHGYMEKFQLTGVKVLDDKLMKYYYVKNKKKNCKKD